MAEAVGFVYKCEDYITVRTALAVILPCKNDQLWKPDSSRARARNEVVQSSKYLGCAL